MKRLAGLWVSALLAVLLMAGMAYYLRHLKPSLVIAQLTFSRESFEAVVSQWSSEQVTRFSQHFKVDYLFLVVYGAFGWLLGSHLTATRRSPSKGDSVLPWLLPIAAASDCLENFLHQTFLSQSNAESLYFVAGVAALVKWALIFVFGVQAIRRWRQNAA